MRVFKLRPGCCAEDWMWSERPVELPAGALELGVSTPPDVLDIRAYVSAQGFVRVFYANGVYYGARDGEQ